MPLQSKRTLKVHEIPVGTTEEQFLAFVKHLCTAPKKSYHKLQHSFTKHFKTSKDEAELLENQDEDKGWTETTFCVQNSQPIGTISFLKKESKDEALVRHSKDNKSPWKDWIVEENFKGITILYQGPNIDEVKVDICAVHGLGGNAIDTWTASKGRMWLRDLLPASPHFEKSRIMTFGYDSDLTDESTVMELENWAETLLMSLNEVRTAEKEKARPLLFVAHSLGGLVVRKAMARLHLTQDCKNITLSQCGILFLATPHSGSTKADWNDFLLATAHVIGGVRRETVNILKSFNTASVWDTSAFLNLNPCPPFRCYAEGLKMCVKGTNQHIVTQASATLGKNQASMIMDVDHSSICKFNSRLGPFVTIHAGLHELFNEVITGGAQAQREMLEACSSRLRATLNGIQSPVLESITRNTVTSGLLQTTPNGISENSLATFQQSTPLNPPPSPPPKRTRRFPRLQERREKIFQSFSFDHLEDRYGSIKLAHQDTCKWLLTNNQFRKWLSKKDHHPILWLKGNPGTGKSTMMKFAVRELSRSHSQDIQIHFFFNARGKDLEKNTTGMYRSLLYQLLSRLPRLKEVIDDFSRSELAEGDNATWMIPQLQDLLLAAIHELGKHRLWVFVDALDEGDEEQVRSMIDFFERLGNEAKEKKVDMRVFFASRHYPRIIIPKSVEITLDTETEHSHDIERYIQSKLNVKSNTTGQEIKEAVNSRASGVFLWVVLVVDILNKAAAGGMGQKAKLNELPSDLSKLFREILTRNLENPRGMQLCIQWVLFAQSPLSREELYFAILSGANEHELASWRAENVTIEVMDAFILSCSKGLVQLSGTTSQFIHETVRDFLLHDNDIKQLIQGNSTQPLSGYSHNTLSGCCLSCITSTPDILWTHGPLELDKWDQMYDCVVKPAREHYWNSKSQSTEKQKIPFMRYSLLHLLEHVNAAEAGGISQSSFLQDFQLRHWLYLRIVFLNLETYILPDSTLLYTLAELDLGSLISAMLRENPPLDFESGSAGSIIIGYYRYQPYSEYLTLDDSGSSPIQLALLKHRYDALVGFLSPGVGNGIENANDALVSAIKQMARTYILIPDSRKQMRYKSILQFFFQWGVESDILTLLQSGRFANDGNILTEMRCSPLSAAAEKGYVGVVRFLLREEDLNRNLQDDDLGLTPLSRACRNGWLPVVRLMVEDGRADINLGCRAFGKPPLTYAAENGILPVVQLLLKYPNRVDFNLRDNEGRTSLFHAARKGHCDIVELFINTPGIDVNSKDEFLQNSLYCTTLHGHEHVVRQLLGSGRVEIDSKDTNGRTPLSIAYEFKYYSIARLLRSHLNADTVNQVIGGIETSQSARKHQVTSLWWAAKQGNHLLVKELLDAGDVEINFRDAKHGRTPLWCAAEQGHEEVVNLLLREEDVNYESKDTEHNQTPLCVAARYGHKGVVRLLLANRDIDLDSEDCQGRTAWMWADLREDDSMREMLFNK